MTDKQTAIEALDAMYRRVYLCDNHEKREKEGHEFDYKTVKAALQSKPVDVEGLKKEVFDYFEREYDDMNIMDLHGDTAIEETIDHLHAKGHLNTPQWQTIETAPRDGTRVLCLTEEGKQRVDGMRKGKWWEMYPRDPYVYWQPLPQPPEDTE